MPYLGSYALNDYLTFYANTHNNKGQARDADSVPTYRVYDGEIATPLLAGSMSLLDDSNTVGFYSEQIQLVAGSGFSQGKEYVIYIAATVQNTDGTISHTFQIGAKVSVPGYVNVTGTVIVGTNNDKTGYSLSDPQNWDLIGNISGSITSVVDAVDFSGDVTVSGTVDANVIEWRGVQPNNLQTGRVDAYVGVNADKTGYSLIDGAMVSVTGTVVASSVTGNVDGTVNAVVDGYVTVSGTVIASSVTGNVGGNVVGSVGSIAAGGITAASIATDAIDADALAADAVTEITNDIFAEAVEGAVTFRQWVRRVSSILFGKASGGGVAGSKKFRDLGDTLNRVDATTDASGNRTSVTFDDS